MAKRLAKIPRPAVAANVRQCPPRSWRTPATTAADVAGVRRAPAGVRQRSPRPPRAFAKSADISVLANARHVRRELFGKKFVTFSSKIDRGGRRGRPPTTAAGPPTAGGRVSDRGGPAGAAANVAVDRRERRGRPPVVRHVRRSPARRSSFFNDCPAVVIFPKKSSFRRRPPNDRGGRPRARCGCRRSSGLTMHGSVKLLIPN